MGGLIDSIKRAVKAPLRPIYWAGMQRIYRWALSNDSLFRKYIASMPNFRIAVAAVTVCNARCIFCNYKTNDEPHIVMEEDLYRKAINQIVAAGYDYMGYGGNSGDGLCDPHIGDRVIWSKKSGMRYIFLGTNGILLSRGDTCEKLLQAVDALYISVPGFDREDYKKVFGVDKCNEVIAGIKKLAATKRALGSKTDVRLAFRIARPWPEVRAEAERLFADELADKTIVISESVNSESMFNLAGEVKEEDMVGTMHVAPLYFDSYYPPCRRPLEEFTVLVDGKVRACNCIYEKTNWDDLVIGDIKEKPLKDILFGERHRKLLHDMANGKWPTVCQKCNVNNPKRLPLDAMASIAVDAARARLGLPGDSQPYQWPKPNIANRIS